MLYYNKLHLNIYSFNYLERRSASFNQVFLAALNLEIFVKCPFFRTYIDASDIWSYAFLFWCFNQFDLNTACIQTFESDPFAANFILKIK